MGKIYDLIPGHSIEDKVIIEHILATEEKANISNYELVNGLIYEINIIKENEEYYISYLDPKRIIKRYFICKGKELYDFLLERVNSSYGDGIDLLILKSDFEQFIITNHDGYIYKYAL